MFISLETETTVADFEVVRCVDGKLEFRSDDVEDFFRDGKVRDSDESDLVRRMVFVMDPIRFDVVSVWDEILERLSVSMWAGDDEEVVSITIWMLLADQLAKVDEGM